MPHVMLPNFRFVFFFVCLMIESFKKVLICHLAMGSIVVFCTIIILNKLNNVVDCMEFKVVKH